MASKTLRISMFILCVVVALLPVTLTALSVWGPISGLLVAQTILAGAALIALVGVGMWMWNRMGTKRASETNFERQIAILRIIAVTWFCGAVVSLVFSIVALINSPQVKAESAKKEAVEKAALLSRTLIGSPQVGKGDDSEGTVLSPAEWSGIGSLLVVRVDIKNDTFSPRIALEDPSVCPLGHSAAPLVENAKVTIHKKYLRAQTGWSSATPGQSADMIVYYINATCQ